MSQYLREVFKAQLSEIQASAEDQAFLDSLENALAQMNQVSQVLEFNPDLMVNQFAEAQESQELNEHRRALLTELLQQVQTLDDAGYSTLTSDEWQYLAHVPHDEEQMYEISDLINVLYVRVKDQAVTIANHAADTLKAARQAAQSEGKRLTKGQVAEILAPITPAQELVFTCGEILQNATELEESFGLRLKVKLVREVVRTEPVLDTVAAEPSEVVIPTETPEPEAHLGVVRFLGTAKNNTLSLLGIPANQLFRMVDRGGLIKEVDWLDVREYGVLRKYLTVAGIQKLYDKGIFRNPAKVAYAEQQGWLVTQPSVEVANTSPQPLPQPIPRVVPEMPQPPEPENALVMEHQMGRASLPNLLPLLTARNGEGFLFTTTQEMAEALAQKLEIQDQQEILKIKSHLAVTRSKFVSDLMGEGREVSQMLLRDRLAELADKTWEPLKPLRKAAFDQVAEEFGHLTVEQFVTGVLQRFDKKVRADMYTLSEITTNPLEQRILVLSAIRYQRLGIDYVQNQLGFQFKSTLPEMRQYLDHVVERVTQLGGAVGDALLIKAIEFEREFLGWAEQARSAVTANGNYLLGRDLTSPDSVKAALNRQDAVALMEIAEKDIIPFLGITHKPLRTAPELLREFGVEIDSFSNFIAQGSQAYDRPFDHGRIRHVREQVGRQDLAFFIDRKHFELKHARFAKDLVSRQELGFVTEYPALSFWLMLKVAMEQSLNSMISELQRKKLITATQWLNEWWNALYQFNLDPKRT